MREADLLRDGLALAVHRTGEGPPLVLQHGLLGDAAQVAGVAPEGFSTWTLECRGHGASPLGPEEGLFLAAFADDLAALVERVGAPAVVGGISMGAALALRLAVRRPGLVAGLVLARPAWGTAAAPDTLAPYAEAGALLAARPPEAALRAFDATDTAARLAGAAPDNLASLRGFFARRPVAGTVALLTRIPRDGPGVTEAELAVLGVPTLVIGNGRDEAHPLATARALAAAIPTARLVEVPAKADDPEAHRAAMRAALGAFAREVRGDAR